MGVTFGDEDIGETTDNEDEPLQVASALSTVEHYTDHDNDDNQDNDGLHVLQALIKNPVSMTSIENAQAGLPAGHMKRFLSTSTSGKNITPMSATVPKTGESKKRDGLRSILKLAGITGKQKNNSTRPVYLTRISYYWMMIVQGEDIRIPWRLVSLIADVFKVLLEETCSLLTGTMKRTGE